MIGYIEEEEDHIAATTAEEVLASDDALVGENIYGINFRRQSLGVAAGTDGAGAASVKRGSIRLTAAGVTLPFSHGRRVPAGDPMVSNNADCNG